MTKVAKRYWGLTFIIGTALTIAVNAAHAKGALAVSGTWTAVAVATCPPAVFAVLAEGYFLVRRSVPKSVQRVLKCSSGGLAAAAFAVSYETSRLFIIAQPGPLPEWTGWVIPGMLDTLVAVSGYVLYVLASHAEVVSTEVRKPRGAGRWSRLADAATNRMEAVLMVPVEPEVDATEVPHGGSVEAIEEGAGTSAETFVEDFAEGNQTSAKPATEVSKTATKVSTKPELEPFMDAASRMVAEGVVARKSAVELAKVIAAIDAGMTDNAIKSAGTASASTAAKVRAWLDQNEQQLDRQLTAVG